MAKAGSVAEMVARLEVKIKDRSSKAQLSHEL